MQDNSIVYKTDSILNMKVGLCFGETYNYENFTLFDVNKIILEKSMIIILIVKKLESLGID
ncbi:hypothetical protein [Clostridium perfringens]|uniref:hypothetical protein n=1 Tax=Clostridium perfringens TaxID=1502 RepID=UPI00123F4D55|nr:hypothetical protein [Clostridium perfringens]MDU7725588.1 hypothetical protein [Clostridium perfringens]BDA29146.1 hypothetical protein CPBEC3_22810 [Clostridium perfringens]HAT4252577.1 hypothetical protein [Clostridium perfringens]HAT4269844.1 hypothetical protein [Clostridium perfringens]